ncbi:MAG: serine/threonine protein kinase [Myxococcota bacterium]|jgi:serine/threonine protein kinase
MGSVYLAEQVAVGRKVAIKILENASADDTLIQRFKREARVIAQLSHPNIVNLIEFGESKDGRLFLVMEYVDGGSLKALIKNEAPLDPQRVIDIASQILEALAAAHERSVVHRDLKPDNLMIASVSGHTDFVKVLDFGIAKVKKAEAGREDTVQTNAGLIVGSLRYISPEQVESREVTPQTDLYSFGGIVYELLTGRRVFDYPSPADCAIGHLTELPPPPVLDGRQLKGPLIDLIMQCLEKKQDRRPPSARVALVMLRACQDDPITNREQTMRHAAIEDSPTLQSIDPLPTETRRELPSPAELVAPPVAETIRRDVTDATNEPTRTVAAARSESEGCVRAITDCALHVAHAAPRDLASTSAVGIPDIQLRSGGPTGGYDIVSSGTGVPAHSQALHHTTTYPVGVRLQSPDATILNASKRGLSPVVLAVGLCALAAIGAAVYLFVIHPAMTADDSTRPAIATPSSEQSPEGQPGNRSVVGVESPGAAAHGGAAELAEAAPSVPSNGVRVQSTPKGATVYRDGNPIGETPVVITWHSSKTAPALRLVKTGFAPQDLPLQAEDRGTARTVKLLEAQP